MYRYSRLGTLCLLFRLVILPKPTKKASLLADLCCFHSILVCLLGIYEAYPKCLRKGLCTKQLLSCFLSMSEDLLLLCLLEILL